MALTDNIQVEWKDNYLKDTFDVASGAIEIFQGAICNFNSSGYVKLGSDTSGEKFAGVAMQYLDQELGGANGDNQIQLIPAKSGKVVKLKLTGVTVANIGSLCYVNGDDAVALAATTTNDVPVGTIVNVAETNYAWVVLD